MKGKVLLIVSLIMILVGSIVASVIQSDFGKIKVQDVRFASNGGRTMSGLLYIPQNATPQTPAPGILAIHGYINSRETQSGFAIEFARRGWVVLALDQSGHGYSSPPVGANGYGAIEGLAYLRNLNYVDKNKIGLEGHSMGGWASVIAASMRPDDYKAMVLEGSSTATAISKQFVPVPGNPAFPKNLAVVFSLYDEFSLLMWETPIAKDVVKSEPLKSIFATKDPIEPGKIYGDLEKGTARILYQPKTTHPGDHLSCSAIGYAVEWFQKTLGDVNKIPSSNQTWCWKEFATLISFIGCLLLIFALGNLLLNTGFFSLLKGSPQNPKPASGAGWWIGAAIMLIIPAVTYFPLTLIGNVVMKASRIFPQQESNNILFWLFVNMAVSFILFIIWHIFNKKKGANAVSYGLKSAGGSTWKKVGLSAVFAIIVMVIAYLLLVIVASVLTVDYRFWIIQLKPMSAQHFTIALRYIILFILFYLMYAVALHGQMRSLTGTLKKRMVVSAVLSSLGYLLLLSLIYVPLFAGKALGVPDVRMTLYAIIAIQVFPLFIIVSLLSTYFYEKTGLVYPGAFVNAIFITWFIIASQATHFPL